jgi:hypothetical protein
VDRLKIHSGWSMIKLINNIVDNLFFTVGA